jgi:hypothetical protein
MNLDKKSADELTQTLMKEFNWGAGPSAGQSPGVMMEMRRTPTAGEAQVIVNTINIVSVAPSSRKNPS